LIASVEAESPDALTDRYAVPDWLTEYVALWVSRLEMGDSWTIRLQLEHCIDNDPYVEAMAYNFAHLNQGKIVFRSDVEDTENWRVTVVHELLHIKHSRIDSFLEKAVFSEMFTDEGRRIVKTGYSQHYESFIHDMACILYKMWEYKQTDNAQVPQEAGSD
jgi:hypothetical protein